MQNKSPIVVINKDQELKSMNFDLWGGLEGFLRDTSNGAGGYATMNLLKRISPFLARGVNMTATAIANLPFDILKIEEDKPVDTSIPADGKKPPKSKSKPKPFDSSDDWKNAIGGMPNPKRLLYNLASSLCAGKAYIIPQYTGTMITDLSYIATHTVLPLVTTGGLQWFTRASDYGNAGVYSPIVPFPAIKQAPNYQEIDKPRVVDIEEGIKYVQEHYYGEIKEDRIKEIILTANNQGKFNGAMMYFWLPDSDIEIGPAKMHSLGTAMNSTQMAASMDNTVRILADRSFVPATIVSAKGIANQQEREKTENWLNSFMRNAFQSMYKIVNSDAVSVVKVGSGMDELKGTYSEIKRQAIEEIGAAFGIPAALFLSDKAFASEVEPMIRQWYESAEFVKIYQTIQETFNDQLLVNYGLKWKFDLTRIKAFQVDEMQRAVAFRDYASARIRPSLVAGILGIDVPEGHDISELDEDFNKPETTVPINPLSNPEMPATEGKDPAQAAANRNQNAAQPAFGKAIVMTPNEMKDVSLWYEVAKRNFLKGKGVAVDFKCKFLSKSIQEQIRAKLALVENELDIVKAFEIEGEQKSEQDDSALLILADALNNFGNVKADGMPQINISMPSINLTAQMPEAGKGNVTVQVPEQPAPIVNVTNQVSPTPVEIKNEVTVQPADVIMPSVNKKVTVKRNINGQIESMESKDK